MSIEHFSIPSDHACLPGHFPGRPVVPGVVILDEVIAAAYKHHPGFTANVTRCKFVQPLRPDVTCEITLEKHGTQGLRFRCTATDQLLATGHIALHPKAHA